MAWTIEIEASPRSSVESFEDAIDEFTDALSKSSAALGAATFFNAITKAFGARFDVEGEDIATVIVASGTAFSHAAVDAGLWPFKIVRAGLTNDEAPNESLRADELVGAA